MWSQTTPGPTCWRPPQRSAAASCGDRSSATPRAPCAALGTPTGTRWASSGNSVPELKDMIREAGGLLTRPLAAREFGWSRQHFHELSQRSDFPDPVWIVGTIELWTRDALVAWRDRYAPRTRIDNLRTRIAQPNPGDPVIFTPSAEHALGV